MSARTRLRKNGNVVGGNSFSNGALFAVLGNRIYRGEISHKGRVYAGQHKAIVSEELWDAVQATRERTRQRGSGAERVAAKSLAQLDH